MALKLLGFVAAGSVVYYVWKDERVKAHVYHMKDTSGSFWINLYRGGQDKLYQFTGLATVDEDGRVLSVEPDPEGTFDAADMDELESVIEESTETA